MGERLGGTRPPFVHPPQLRVVGLGASAGGIKVLRDFFAHVEPQSGAAYVVVLHLSPDHESPLADVLQTSARVPVRQVTSEVVLEPDRVYVASPNKSVQVAEGILRVADFTSREQRKSPVDLCFRALADAQGARSACVVLSGTGANGSAGLKRVKACGGLVIAQDPDEAEYADMPRNAIATGLVDLVLPAAKMPAGIAAYFDGLQRDDATPAAGLAGGPPESLRDVLTVLHVRTGHDFSNYKDATVRRRVERRMHLRGVPGLDVYAQLVRHEPDEAVSLMKELLISVTDFFRDESAWAVLAQRIVPRLFQGRTAQDQVRVWVPGCATGEEAYSMAILLAEYAAGVVDPPSVQIFASDLDEAAVATARDGVYTEAALIDVSEARRQRFFEPEAGGYRVGRELRELVLFAHHNMIKDPPFSRLDLISCRNLLIYLNRAIQDRVVETFHFALRPGGYLFLGASESPESTDDLFLRIEPTARIYESRTVTSRPPLPLNQPPALPPPGPRAGEPRPAERVSPAELHQRLLEQYAPPSVIVTAEHNLVHLSERAGRYMRVAGGEPSRDLLALIRPELRPALRAALRQAVTRRTTVTVRGVSVPVDGADRLIDMSVRPVLRNGGPGHGYFLITFDDGAAEAGHAARPVALMNPAPVTPELDDELVRLRAELRTTVQQYETQVEEAQAANEELQAMNEELRSAAEELETSQEELQSLNEELTTVNQELKIKIEELGLANNHLQNLINATDIGTIFLDQGMRVRFSTPPVREIFNLLESDTGRPLSDITNKLVYDGIHQDARTVLDRLVTVEREIQAENGRWHLMRMLPYRTSDNRIDGAVITFLDITERRLSEIRVRQSEERLRMLIDGALDYAIFTMTEEGVVDSWNPGAERMFGYSPDEIIGSSVAVLFTPEDRAAGIPHRELTDARRSGRAVDERYHLRRDGSRFFCSGVTRPLRAPRLGFAKIARDLTVHREAADALQQAHDEVEQRVRQRTSELQASVEEHESAKVAVTDLLHRLVTAQEDERARIARDLHDHLGQQLTALRLALERMTDLAGDAKAAPQPVDRALDLVRQIGRDLDFLAWQLRPAVLDELGLAAALPRFVREWSSHVGIPAEFRFGGFEPGQLSREAEVTFYRIAQEALNNIAKHAQASRADVILATNLGNVVLVIDDDGVGFEAEDPAWGRKSFGLAGMRERAALIGATLQIESTPGQGTSVFLRCPVHAGPRREERESGS